MFGRQPLWMWSRPLWRRHRSCRPGLVRRLVLTRRRPLRRPDPWRWSLLLIVERTTPTFAHICGLLAQPFLQTPRGISCWPFDRLMLTLRSRRLRGHNRRIGLFLFKLLRSNRRNTFPLGLDRLLVTSRPFVDLRLLQRLDAFSRIRQQILGRARCSRCRCAPVHLWRNG